MQHFANFGIVKQANKQLKRLNELSISPSVRTSTGEGGLGRVAEHWASERSALQQGTPFYARAGHGKRLLNTRLGGDRAVRASANVDPLTRPYEKPYKPEGYIPENPKHPDWSDIRKTSDTAASTSGYLGFRTDPYKGYGGMMEEPVPRQDLLNKTRLKRVEEELY